jgi:hypothetical protein
MATIVYSPAAASVADVRREEIAQLLSAFETLHVEGVIDPHEYRAKRRRLTADSRSADASAG